MPYSKLFKAMAQSVVRISRYGEGLPGGLRRRAFEALLQVLLRGRSKPQGLALRRQTQYGSCRTAPDGAEPHLLLEVRGGLPGTRK